MKVLLINTSEQTGGAAIAASRLTKALNKSGVEATLLVGNKQTASPEVIATRQKKRLRFNFLWERFIIWTNNLFSRKNLFKVSIANTGINITGLKEYKEADVVHLHWINQGMLSLGEISKIIADGKKMVWTLHDMWPLTGICHHAYSCNYYQKQCGQCPYLRFPSSNDLSHKVWKKKNKVYDKNIRIVAVSSWLADKAKESSLLGANPVTVIPNTFSSGLFRTLNKDKCRVQLSIPTGKYVIAFGAARIDDPIKGYSYLKDAVSYLIENRIIPKEQLHLLFFGNWKGDRDELNNLPVSFTYMGRVGQEKLPEVYSAADVLVSSSLYETFGQTIIEAQACGCIPVCFDNSGPTDIISHKENGYLAQYLSVADLAEGIRWAIQDTPEEVSVDAMQLAVREKYSEEAVAAQYIELYKKL